MRSGFLQASCLIALCGLAVNAPAQNSAVPPDVQAFAAQYVAAYNAQDRARFESLNVPQWRGCMTPETRDIYDTLFAEETRDSVAPHYRLTFLPVNEGNVKALSTDDYFPVKPERELHIDYEYPGTNDGGQLILWLVHVNGRWLSDSPCMTAHGIQSYRDNEKAREQYKAMATAIREPLRSELLAMLRVHKMGEAETRYREVTGSDMRTAMLVINALQNEGR